MILLDTHIWVWHVDESDRLTERHREIIKAHEADGLAVSVMSCWEVAKLVEYDRLDLDVPMDEWMADALTRPGIHLIDLTPQIAVASTQLPSPFHRDPADQIIVATARTYDLEILTTDRKILKYEHVKTA